MINHNHNHTLAGQLFLSIGEPNYLRQNKARNFRAIIATLFIQTLYTLQFVVGKILNGRCATCNLYG